MTRVLLVSPDRVGPRMAGPGIRYVELARALAAHADVRVAAPLGSSEVEDAPAVETYDPEGSRALLRLAGPGEVVIAPPLPPRLCVGLGGSRRPWIVDLYNPEPFEGLEHQRERPRRERKARDVLRIDRIAYAARRGTGFVCASERQRDMWLGFLAANRRLDSDVYERDPELRSLIDVVPSGLPANAPEPAAEPAVRGRVFPGDARIMVWNGGLWDWLDPLTILRALALLRAEDERWRLLFAGTSRPSHREDMSMAGRAISLARELGLEEAGAVHFRPGWTPYRELGSLLLECDVGVCAHHRTLETRFAFRTRILDFVWAGLPVLYTEGDEWSERVQAGGLGEVVPPDDPDAFAAGARRIVEHGSGAYADALAAEAARSTWSAAAEPLARMLERVAGSPRRPRLAGRALALRHATADRAARAARARPRRRS